jgi:hypothetical protein
MLVLPMTAAVCASSHQAMRLHNTIAETDEGGYWVLGRTNSLLAPASKQYTILIYIMYFLLAGTVHKTDCKEQKCLKKRPTKYHI